MNNLSSIEKLYLTGEVLSPPFAIQIIIEGNGDFAEEQFTNAVFHVSSFYPYLTARLIKGKWVLTRDSLPIRKICLSSLQDELQKRLSISHMPVEILWGQEGNKIKIAFRALHILVDARGFLLFIEDVFRYLRGEVVEGSASGMTEESFIKSRKNVFKRPPLRPKYNSPVPLNREYGVTPSFIIRKTIKGTDSHIIAKIISFLGRDVDSSLFMIPVDLRRHQDAENSVRNLSLPIFINQNKQESWISIQEKIIHALQKEQEISEDGSEAILSLIPFGLLRYILKKLIRYQDKNNKFLMTSLISHLGKIPLRKFTFKGFHPETLYSLPVDTLISPLSLVITDCLTHTEVLMASSGDESSYQCLEELMERLAVTLSDNKKLVILGDMTGDQRKPPLISLFQSQVQLNPSSLCYQDEFTKVSYQQLDKDSDILAEKISRRVKGVGKIVALYLDRSYHSLVSIIATIKAGSAFLPIDTKTPLERVLWMIKDSQSSLCLVESKDAHLFDPSMNILCIDDQKDEGEMTVFSSQENEIAYVIYTSGSTGSPKGVCIGQQSLSNYLIWSRDFYKTDESTCFAFFTSFSFDLTLTSILLPLISGGSLYGFSQDLDHMLLKNILSSPVNSLKVTPTHLDLIHHLDLSGDLKLVVVGGEQLKDKTARYIHDNFGKCRVVNEYGPTEATVGCIVYEFKPDRWQENIPIGLPISGTKIYLLDDNQSLMKENEVGEIYIGGECLALGYLNRADLDEQKYIVFNDPDGNKVRVYRTGDLAQYNSGVLEYIGRNDRQVKIRGHRIELGEIEALLENRVEIKKAVVLKKKNGNGKEFLVAYLFSNEDLNLDKLRAELSLKLPHYMCPSFYLYLKELPMTMNGKIDYDRLPSLSSSVLSTEEFSDLDKDENELRIIWSHILGISLSEIKWESHFFHLGGDSLLLIHLISAIGKGKGQDYGSFLRSFMENPTFQNCYILWKKITFESK